MSNITDIILLVNINNESEKRKIKFINFYLLSESHQPLEKSTANGGEKVFTGSIYQASFNCFDIPKFLEQVEINFNGDDDAFQVLAREEDLYHFKIVGEKIPKWI